MQRCGEEEAEIVPFPGASGTELRGVGEMRKRDIRGRTTHLERDASRAREEPGLFSEALLGGLADQ